MDEECRRSELGFKAWRSLLRIAKLRADAAWLSKLGARNADPAMSCALDPTELAAGKRAAGEPAFP